MTLATPLTLETISTQLSNTQKADFFDQFWAVWSTNGFGTLTKKDTELLIYSCLKKALGSKSPKTNYEWATLLRLTPSRIKTIRLESHLRFGELAQSDGASDLVKFFQASIKLNALSINGLISAKDLNEVTVSWVVEDPVIQMEMENMLKSIGSYLDFHRNREIVRMGLINFFKIIGSNKQREIIDKWVTDLAENDKNNSELIKRIKAKKYATTSELGKINLFIEDLAKFAKVDGLIDHLKMIFSSQNER